MIIALHSPGFNFFIEEGKKLFPGVPVINLIAGAEFLNDEDLRGEYERLIGTLKRPFVILPYSTDVKSTLKSIIRLRPDTRNLVVITGAVFWTESWGEPFAKACEPACDALEELAGTGDIFTIGLPEKGELYGSATIIIRKGSQLTTGEVVETFMQQAGMALQRVLAEDELKQSEERFRQMAENVGDFLWEVDAEGVYRYTSPSVEKILGYKPDELVGKKRKGNPDGREARTPIIALTAGVMEQKRSSPLAGVFDDWVYKPFREMELFEKLAKHLGAQFVYQGPRPQEKGPAEPALRAGDLTEFPRDWLKRFQQAVKRGRTRLIQELIEEIRPEFGPAARGLTDLVNLYQFEALIALTSEALRGQE